MSKVFIGRVNRDARERDIEELCSKFGTTRSVTLKPGYAFVDFTDPKDAEDCCADLNNTTFFGDRIAVELAKGDGRSRRDDSRGRGRDSSRERGGGRFGPPARTKNRLLIENLDQGASWQDLKDYFRTTGGNVTFADAHRATQGQGVVDFATEEEMKTAIEKLDDTEFRGKRITVREIDADDSRGLRSGRSPPRRRYSRSPRRRSRSRDVSRSRHHRRSRSRDASRSRHRRSRRDDSSPSPRRDRRRRSETPPRRRSRRSPSVNRDASPVKRDRVDSASPAPKRNTRKASFSRSPMNE